MDGAYASACRHGVPVDTTTKARVDTVDAYMTTLERKCAEVKMKHGIQGMDLGDHRREWAEVNFKTVEMIWSQNQKL
jgi:hypothetical protein